LHEGIAAAKAGERERARDLLVRVVEQDEDRPQAWLWLSGVVDDLEDREICLENVLALDPENPYARKGLALVREKLEAQSALVRVDTAQEEAESSPESPVETSEAPPERAQSNPVEALRDPYLCPYCAAPTSPDDRRCPSCEEKLWVKGRKKEKRSALLWILIVLQALNTLGLAVSLAFLIYLLAESGEVINLLSIYMELPPSVTPEGIRSFVSILIAISSVTFLLSLAGLIGLFVRWPIVYYLLLVQAVIEILGAVLSLVSSPSICSVFPVVLSIGWLVLIFQLEDEFLVEKRRILMEIDPRMTNVDSLVRKAATYNEQGMWAAATLCLQRALGLQHTRIDIHLALTTNYIRLRRYDWAERQLAQAKRVDPQHARIEQLEDLLHEIRS
jgi:tetratricopeptide (TPR) repeat protein